MNRINTSLKALQSFHNDEDGMETMQVVMLVALGAFIMIVLNQWGDKILEWAKGLVSDVVAHDDASASQL
jgi:hypothetical protein